MFVGRRCNPQVVTIHCLEPETLFCHTEDALMIWDITPVIMSGITVDLFFQFFFLSSPKVPCYTVYISKDPASDFFVDIGS